MLFCTECGGALNLFESNDDQICWNCIRKKENPKPQKPQVIIKEPLKADDLEDATFSVEGNMLVLKAKEGWILWSGPTNTPTPIRTIMERARRIHTIRSKRKKATTSNNNNP